MTSQDTTAAATAGTALGAKTLSGMANAIRALSMDAVEAAKSGHPGMPMGMADVASVLYAVFEIRRWRPEMAGS